MFTSNCTYPLLPFLFGVLFFWLAPPVHAVPLDSTTTAVTVSWDRNPEPDIAYYSVRYGNYSGSAEHLVASDGPANSLDLTHLGPGTWYCAVQATNTSGLSSPYSDEVSFEIAAKPVGPAFAVRNSAGAVFTTDSGTISMGTMRLGASSSRQSITVENVGGQALAGLALSASGDDFSISPLGATSLDSGASTTFTVVFNPLVIGDRSGTIVISSASTGGKSFQLNLNGVGTAVAVPAIAVERASAGALTDDVSSVSFNPATVGGTSNAETFTIRNNGSAPLAGLAVNIAGAAAADFMVTALSTAVLPPGAAATFEVYFKPTHDGTRVASLQIASNDPAKISFDVALVGTGINAPEIAVSRAGIDLVDGASGFGFGGVQTGKVSATQVFTIANKGTAVLSGLKINIDGKVPEDFTVVGPTASSLLPGATTTFQVSFKPSARGARVAGLHLASNDSDESPFDIVIGGSGIGVPEIEISHGTGDILTNRSFAAPGPDGVLVGSSGAADTYTIRSIGTSDLAGIGFTIDGPAAGDFSVSGPVSSTLSPGNSGTFQVTFHPTAAGYRTAILHVASNDADENPFDIPLAGKGIAPPPALRAELALTRNDALLDAELPVGFGKALLDSSSAGQLFTITNTGTADLTGLQISTSGTGADDFVVKSGGATTLAPGESSTFKVNFNPTAAGSRVASLLVTGDDTGAGVFKIELNGTGVVRPHIEVQSGGRALRDGSSYLSLGTSSVGSTSKSQILTIRNNGTGKLSGLAITGASSEFAVSELKVESLAPGKSTSVWVTFKPRKKGTRWGSLHIASNDKKSGKFDIVLTGYGDSSSGKTSSPKAIAVKSAFVRSTAAPAAPAITSGVEVIGGVKYRSLTIIGGAGVNAGDIEVSGNLLDWSSGAAHTTVMVDSGKTLKVRDNTPVTADNKRYIRVRPVASM